MAKAKQTEQVEDRVTEIVKIVPLEALTKTQKEYLKSLDQNIITVATGHSGSGKTYCATYKACQMLQSGEIDQIVLTRPYAHLGADYGAVPGNDFEKLEGFVRPMLDTCKKVLGAGKLQHYIETSVIEVAPLEKIQGRSFDHRCAIIADEVQNATRAQAVSLVTRIGKEVAFLAICGDPRQSIKKDKLNTLDWVDRFMTKYEVSSTGVVRFTEEDCVRSGIVREILVALEKEGGYYTDLED